MGSGLSLKSWSLLIVMAIIVGSPVGPFHVDFSYNFLCLKGVKLIKLSTSSTGVGGNTKSVELLCNVPLSSAMV